MSMFSSLSATDSSESRSEFFMPESHHSDPENFKFNDVFSSPTSCLTPNLDSYHDIGSATPRCKRSAFSEVPEYFATPAKSVKPLFANANDLQSDNFNAECPGAPRKAAPQISRLSPKRLKSVLRPLNFDEVAYSPLKVA